MQHYASLTTLSLVLEYSDFFFIKRDVLFVIIWNRTLNIFNKYIFNFCFNFESSKYQYI